MPPAPGAISPTAAEQRAAPTTGKGEVASVELTHAQQTIARRMAESKATAPDFFIEMEVDMTQAVAYRDQLRQQLNPAPTYNDMVVLATALALRQYPRVNGAYRDGQFEFYSDINIGIVVSAAETLLVPTLSHADRKGLAQIAIESRDLAYAVRARTLHPSQLSGGTFTISNLGMFGIDRFTAVINPPQAGIIAVGAITPRPAVAEDGRSLVVKPKMTVTMSCDHRILYGADAAEMLGAVRAWLEQPYSLPL